MIRNRIEMFFIEMYFIERPTTACLVLFKAARSRSTVAVGYRCQDRLRFTLLITLLCGIAFCGATATELTKDQATPAQIDFFEKRVRPVLAANCFSCHGAETQEAGLRLDSRESILKGSEERPVVKVGQPDHSLLVQAIGYEGDLQMPPSDKLPAESIAALRQWISKGLVWPAEHEGRQPDTVQSHWAFQPVRQPEVPKVANAHWARTSIDRFVLAKLERHGLQPSAQADRPTLLRRATFDLIGLPPTPEQIARFLTDRSPDAFARVVDRLLNSPHYGERWGRHWLDVARYADSGNRWAYKYRDYVVRALNHDLPFNRFVVEQLAADQLQLGSDQRPLAAMGFLTAGNRFFAEFDALHDIMDDRIDVVTRGLLGLTVTCARCHDHKYDPVTQADYYALYGVFRSSVEPLVPPLLRAPERNEQFQKYVVELRQRKKKLMQFVDQKHAQLVRTARRRTAEHLMAAYARRDHPETEGFLLLQATEDELQPVVMRRWRIYLRRARRENDPVWQPWHRLANLDRDEFADKAAVVISQFRHQDSGSANRIVLQALPKRPGSMNDVAQAYARVLQRAHRQWQDTVAQAAALDNPKPTKLKDDDLEQLRRVFDAHDGPPNLPKSYGPRFAFVLRYEPVQAEFLELLNALREWINFGNGAPPRATVLVDTPEPFEPRVFIRGNSSQLGQPVPRRFLSVLGGNSAPFSQGSGRLQLAQAIADPNNPLTARVIVNRIWMHHFGEGLVRTPSDFGTRSDPPSHPELLDHLASTFVKDGWSMKRLHGRIMLSATYQQQSEDRSECLEIDPANRLLWKMNRRRLDFESTRDALLAVANQLDPAIGGPPDEEIVAGMVESDVAAEQFEEPAEFNKQELQERIARLREELQVARAMDNQAEVEEVTQLLQRLQRRITGREADARQRRVDRLQKALAEARAMGNEAEVGEIQELLSQFDAQSENEIDIQDPNAWPSPPSRRTLYAFVERGNLPELFRVFDFPSPSVTNAQRTQTTVPPQALFLMNNRFVLQCARRLVERPGSAATPTVENKITYIHRLLFGREPNSTEWVTAKRFLGTNPSSDTWADFVHALMMTNEFVFVD